MDRKRPVQDFAYNLGVEPKQLSKAEERELIIKAQAGDFTARNALVTANMRYAIKWAGTYSRGDAAFQDRINIAAEAMMHAVKKFDLTSNVRFLTYATYWIRQYLQRHFLENFSQVRIKGSEGLKMGFFRLNKLLQKYPDLTDEQASKILSEGKRVKIKPAEVKYLRGRYVNQDSYLGEPATNQKYPSKAATAITKQDILPSKLPPPDELCEHEQNRELVRRAIFQLDARERDIILNYTMEREKGVQFQPEKTKLTLVHSGGSTSHSALEIIAQRWGITRQRAHQIQLNALAKMKRFILRFRRRAKDG